MWFSRTAIFVKSFKHFPKNEHQEIFKKINWICRLYIKKRIEQRYKGTNDDVKLSAIASQCCCSNRNFNLSKCLIILNAPSVYDMGVWEVYYTWKNSNSLVKDLSCTRTFYIVCLSFVYLSQPTPFFNILLCFWYTT